MNAERREAVRVGMIGLGFMGARHVRAYLSASEAGFPCELVAVADPNESRRAQIASAIRQRVRSYPSAEELIADPEIDLLSICTHTDTHVALAAAALKAQKHVLVEKPLSLRADEIRSLDELARRVGKICMPAMCMRFWPGWDWLKARIDDGAYGKCESMSIQRLSAPPAWAWDFYGDGSLSGGAIVDLHIHDADFVRYCFGDPDTVSSAGRIGTSGAVDHLTTLYRYERGNGPAHVVAEGGWDHAPGFGFTMRYIANFQAATASFDLARDGSPLVLCGDDACESVLLDPIDGYDGEIRHIISAITSGTFQTRVTLADAIAVTELIDTERRSIDRRESIQFRRK